uniref:Uncharacterized protein n=1 Tax=Cacopsylla melanoneura TaxID=428564 RepID=A0A8D9EPN0_9HEMI
MSDDSELSELDTVEIRGPYDNDNDNGGGVGDYDEDDSTNADAHLKFVRVLKQYPIILSKSQMPCVKLQKNQAIQCMKDQLEQETGTRYNEKQILKKVNNMKTKVRGKMVRWETNGSKRIKMPRWADELLDLISGDYTTETHTNTNEDISQNYIPASDTEDFKPQHTAPRVVLRTSSTSSVSGGTSHNASTAASSNNRAGTGSSSLLMKSALEAYETDETRHMSNADLQRLVYLEQLKLARLQMNYYKQKTTAQRKSNNR